MGTIKQNTFKNKKAVLSHLNTAFLRQKCTVKNCLFILISSSISRTKIKQQRKPQSIVQWISLARRWH